MNQLPNRSRKLEYKWVIIGICFVMVFVCLGFCSGNKSLYLVAITEALGIQRSLFSINDSCRFISTAVVNLFFGTLIQRFGEKKMILAGFCSLIISTLLYASANQILVFYLGGIFLGIGLSWTTTTMVGYVVGKWCSEHRGTIMGFVLAGNGVGGALAAQIISPIIYNETNAFGYRRAYLLTAGILAVVAVLVLILFREAPTNSNEQHTHKKKRGDSWVGISFQAVSKKPLFYLAAICVFLTGASLQSISGIASAHMKDVGLDASYIATILSFHALALAAAKFLSGVSYDNLGLRVTILACDVIAVTAIILLACISNSATGRVLAMIYGIISSFAMPLETIMLPLIVSDLFGQHSYAKLLGLFVSVNTAGYAIGTPIANLVYDMCGTYTPVLIALACIMLAITLCFQYIINEAHKMRQAIEE